MGGGRRNKTRENLESSMLCATAKENLVNLCRSGQSVHLSWVLNVFFFSDFVWMRWREQISRSWTTGWQPDPSRSRWSDASRGSRTIRSCGQRCNAMSGCTFCRTPSWCMRQCPASEKMRRNEWQCVVVAAVDQKIVQGLVRRLGLKKLYVSLASTAFWASSSVHSVRRKRKFVAGDRVGEAVDCGMEKETTS